MNTTYNQYCKYLKHLLEVECAEKELDFNKIFISYLKVQKEEDDKKEREEAEKQRLEEERRQREEARQKELEEKQRKDAERQLQIEKELAEQKRREEEAKKKALENEVIPEKKKRGDLEFEDGYYIGDTKDGLMHGHGTRYWDENDKKWEGDWVEGEACGHIVVTFGDFVVYDGQMEHGLPNGQGVYTDINSGQRYEGNFVDFMRNGEGILYTEDGDKIYDGEWENNKYNGYGQFFLRGQCRYEGNWENGKRNGDGIAYDQNGQVEYDGSWKDDVRLNDIDRIKVASEG